MKFFAAADASSVTYVLSEDGKTLTVTAPDAEALGAFAQVWDAMGGETWNLDGTTATKAE